MRPTPPTPRLFPYTTLFRSHCTKFAGVVLAAEHQTCWFSACGVARDLMAAPVQHLQLRLRGAFHGPRRPKRRSEEHTSELQSRGHLVCRLLLEKKNTKHVYY